MKRIFAILVAVVMCVTLFAACGDKNEKAIQTGNEDLNQKIALKVGDVEISQAFFNFMYSMNYDNMAQYEQFYGEDWENMEVEEGKTMGDYINESTKIQIEQLISSTVLAEKKGIKAKDVKEAVADQKKQVVESYGGEEAYVEFLKSANTTDAAIVTYLETYEILNRLYEKLIKKGGEAYVEDSAIEKEFLESYKEKLRVQHILISTMADEQTGAAGKTDEEALKIANEVVAKLNKGEDFDKLIPDYNEDPGMSSGQYYVFGEGEMVPEFEKASKELKVGEYTKTPVKSDYGYHIIKKYEINKEIPEYEEFATSKKQQKTTEVIEAESKKLTFKWDDKVVKESIKTIKDSKAAAKAAAKAESEANATEESAAQESAATESAEAEKTEK